MQHWESEAPQPFERETDEDRTGTYHRIIENKQLHNKSSESIAAHCTIYSATLVHALYVHILYCIVCKIELHATLYVKLNLSMNE